MYTFNVINQNNNIYVPNLRLSPACIKLECMYKKLLKTSTCLVKCGESCMTQTYNI